MKLINEAGTWQYQKKKFIIPLEDTESYIEDEKSKKVLGLRFKKNVGVWGVKAKLLQRNSPASNEQLWIRKRVNNSTELFTLTNKETGELLSAKNPKETVKGGMYFQKILQIYVPNPKISAPFCSMKLKKFVAFLDHIIIIF